MKKLLALLMAAVLFFVLTSCLGSESADTGSGGAVTESAPTTAEYQEEILQKFLDAYAYIETATHISYDTYGKVTMKMPGAEMSYDLSGTVKSTVKNGSPIHYSTANIALGNMDWSAILAYENGIGYYSDGMTVKLRSACGYEEFLQFVSSQQAATSMVPNVRFDSFAECTFEETESSYIGSFHTLTEESLYEIETYLQTMLADQLGDLAEAVLQITGVSMDGTVSKSGYVEKMTMSFSAVITALVSDQQVTMSFDAESTLDVQSIDKPLTVILPFNKKSFIPTESLSLGRVLPEKMNDYLLKTYGEFESSVSLAVQDIPKGLKATEDAVYAVRYEGFLMDSYSMEGTHVYNEDEYHFLEYYKDGILYSMVNGELQQGKEYSTALIDEHLSDYIRPVLYFDSITSMEYRENDDGVRQLVCHADGTSVDAELYAGYAIYNLYADADELYDNIERLDTATFTYTFTLDEAENITAIEVLLQTTAIIEGHDDCEISYYHVYTITRTGGADIHPIGPSGNV